MKILLILLAIHLIVNFIMAWKTILKAPGTFKVKALHFTVCMIAGWIIVAVGLAIAYLTQDDDPPWPHAPNV